MESRINQQQSEGGSVKSTVNEYAEDLTEGPLNEVPMSRFFSYYADLQTLPSGLR